LCGIEAAVAATAKQSRRRRSAEAAVMTAAHCRRYAAELRVLADGEPDAGFRAKLTAIAEQYEARAGRLNPR
jgi:hypothetical protein